MMRRSCCCFRFTFPYQQSSGTRIAGQIGLNSSWLTVQSAHLRAVTGRLLWCSLTKVFARELSKQFLEFVFGMSYAHKLSPKWVEYTKISSSRAGGPRRGSLTTGGRSAVAGVVLGGFLVRLLTPLPLLLKSEIVVSLCSPMVPSLASFSYICAHCQLQRR